MGRHHGRDTVRAVHQPREFVDHLSATPSRADHSDERLKSSVGLDGKPGRPDVGSGRLGRCRVSECRRAGREPEKRRVRVGGDRLYAFAAECGSETCPPVWVGPRQSDPSLPEPRRWSLPAVRPNMVFSSADRPYAFRAGCAEREQSVFLFGLGHPWPGPPLPPSGFLIGSSS